MAVHPNCAAGLSPRRGGVHLQGALELEEVMAKMAIAIEISLIRVHERLTIPRDLRVERQHAVARHDMDPLTTQRVPPAITLEWGAVSDAQASAIRLVRSARVPAVRPLTVSTGRA